MTTTIEYALMSGRAYQTTRAPNGINWLPVPTGWSEFLHVPNDTLPSTGGFEMSAFQNIANPNEIVISFAGTGPGWGDWTHGNTPLALGLLATQLNEAADYYLQIKAQNPDANITLTGHSLGGGLAALIAVMFDETAVTFDQAPFNQSALFFSQTSPTGEVTTTSVALALRQYLADHTSNTMLAKLDAYIAANTNNSNPIAGDTVAGRADNVTDINVQGEILSGLFFNRIGTQTDLLSSHANVSAIDLHSITLLTAFLQSGDTAASTATNHTLGQVTFKLVNLLQMIFDTNLYYNDPNNLNPNAPENFLERIVKHEAGNGTALPADAMVTRFTSDLWKLAQDGGLTMTDGNPTNATLNKVSKTLIAFAMQFYYEDTANAKDATKELFKDLSTAGAGSNGITFDIADVSKDIKAAIDANQNIDLTKAKGYELYFQAYLNNIANFTIEEMQLIQTLLPTMRDWYVQAGATGMTATGSHNRHAFMLGGTTNDNLIGGNKSDLLVGNAGNDTLYGGDGDDVILGGANLDTLHGDAGNDVLLGGNDVDILDGGEGNDQLKGGAGLDVYQFNGTYGTDIITDSDGQGSITIDNTPITGGKQIGDNRVYQTDDKQHTYVYVSGNKDTGGDVLIDSHILIKNFSATGTDLGLTMDGPTAESLLPIITGNASDNFINTTVYNKADEASIYAAELPTDSSQHPSDTGGLTGGAVANLIEGRAGSDIISGGAGNDRIYGNTSVTIDQAIINGNTQGGSGQRGDWLAGGAGEDTLIGYTGNDVLAGGAGKDTLIGGAGDDDILGDNDWIATSFEWTITDTVDERLYHPVEGTTNPADSGADLIYGGKGNDHVYAGEGNDIVYGEDDDDTLIGEAGDDVLVGGEGDDAIYGDASYNPSAIGNDVLFGGAGNDFLMGHAGDDYLDGGTGIDILYGGAGKDILIGNGEDTLKGGAEDDTYYTQAGDIILDPEGHNTIHVTNATGLSATTKPTISSTTDATLNLALNDGTTLTLEAALYGTGANLQFAGGESIDLEAWVSTNLTDGARLSLSNINLGPGAFVDYAYGGAGDDQIVGGSANDTIKGYGGSDTLLGAVGNDMLFGGAGNDHVQGDAGDDVLEGGEGDDELQGNFGNDVLVGGSGNDTIFGQEDADILDGGLGNDVLVGNAGDDVYKFNLGGGQDTVWEEVNSVGDLGDVLRFGDGILASDIIVNKSGGDLILRHINGIDQVIIKNWYFSSNYELKQFEFADGTIWNGNNTAYLGSLRGTEGNEEIFGTMLAETLYGMGGNDSLYGNGGTDIFIGGKGNDRLVGGVNKDTFVFALGDGADTIIQANYLDTLRFESDIQSTDISAERVGFDLVLRHQNGLDSVTLQSWYFSSAYQLKNVTFAADGTSLSAATLSQMGSNIDHNYALNIGDGTKNIDDWGGTDILTIGSGILDANIVFTRVGQDLQVAHTNGVDKVIIKEWFNDITKQIENIVFTSSGTQIAAAQINSQFTNITGTSGDDVLHGGNAFGEVILGLGGNDTIYGNGGNDQITGGTGNDTLYGGAGGNIYYFNMGDGQDYINPESQSFATSTIIFGAGLFELFNRSSVYGQNTVYSFNNSTDKVTLEAYYQASLKFVRTLTSQADNFAGSDWDELIYGLGGNDIIDGGKGNDTVYGEDGNDNIHGGEGYDTMYGGDGDDILDGFGVLSSGEFANDGSRDSYIGGKGNDTLNGNSGNDSYYFNLGDGKDVIIEGAFITNGGQRDYSTNDQIIFGDGITSESIELSKVGSDLLVKVSAMDSITVKNWFVGYESLIDSFVFNDGSTVNSNEITKKIFTVHGTAGNDVLTGDSSYVNFLYGESGNDTLNGGNNADELHGGTGNDNLNGGSGNDSYYFERGGGQDQVLDAIGTDYVYFDASITSADINLSRSQNDLVMTVNNNGGILTINSYFVSSTNIVENFIFIDGSTLPSNQAIQDSLFNIRGTSGDDNLLGTAYTNAIYGGDGNDILRGLEGDDTLSGESGNDTLDGGLENDQLSGGDGNDIYLYTAGDGSDSIFETGGDDSLILGSIGITELSFQWWSDARLYINFASGGSVNAKYLERLVFADGSALGLSDYQFGNGTLNGTAEDSILIGYGSSDTGANNIFSGGYGNDLLDGGAGSDTLNGGNGNDWLVGGTGSYADNMVGNAGNDIYYVDYRNDAVTEQLNEGLDTVISAIAYTLGSNVENLTLSGTGSINGTGNALDNVFKGNSAANSFTGGLGNDTYYLSTGDSAVEGTAAGTDVVYTDATYTLGTNIENGFIVGAAAVNLTGNALSNVLTGNAAANILNGGTGADTLTGGLGDDTYLIDVATDVVLENANEGSDTIQVGYATTAATTLTTGAGQFTNIENITVTGTGLYNLTGDANNNTLIGNASANVLTGNAGNDVLNGLAGNDTMTGGMGNDTYTIDVAGDVVTESLNEGIDSLNVGISTSGGTYTLGNNIENGALINTVAFTLTGNALDNVLNGNAAANTLNGGDGNDVLDGKAGSDNMAGGLGNDTYFADVTGDVITEAVSAGMDTVNVGIATAGATYTVSANVENAKLTNTVAYNLTGNALANFLMGNAANNTFTDSAGGNDILQGLAGVDTFNDTVGNNLFDGGVGNDIITAGSGRDLLMGGFGNDTITTGTGYDVIVFNKGDGADIVNASTGADNTLSLGGNFAYSDLSLTKTGNDLILKMGATDQVTLKDWYLGTTNKSVVNLQVIAEAMQGFNLGSADSLRNNNVETFNFTNLVTAFDAAGATANWQLTDERLTAHLQAGSDNAAIGGDLAYQYGKNNNLTGMGLLNAQSVISSASFGQTAQTLNNPSVWQAELVKLG